MRKIAILAVIALVLVGACVAFSRIRTRGGAEQPGTTSQREYTADHVLTQVLPVEGNRSVTMKLYRKGLKMREDRQTRRGPKITIMRPDIGKMWTVYPNDKAYTEGPCIDKPIVDILRLQIPDLKQVGTSTVNGRKCDQYRGTNVEPKPDPRMSGGDRRTEITVWVDSALDLPVKEEFKDPPGSVTMAGNPVGGFVDEYRNIRVGPQPDSLFELPKGYKQIQPPPAPAMPQMPMPGAP